MGRGRAKAKQTKVARELKYRSFETDFSSLERELRSGSEGHDVPPAYADLVEEQEDDEDPSGGEREYGHLRKSG
ncbi:MAG TPA: DUF3073 domain-containing protein [Propionibacteriaceae bacterium]|nr:DUF3073 domain-containing protein [Propionibacteriaceae bacterium]